MATGKFLSSDAFVGVDDALGVSEHVTTHVVTPQDGRIIIDNPELLFLGSFERQGDDLLLTYGNEASATITTMNSERDRSSSKTMYYGRRWTWKRSYGTLLACCGSTIPTFHPKP